MDTICRHRKTGRPLAFTLVEIMIVIAIIGILAGMAIPNFRRLRDQAREKKCFEYSSLLTRTSELYYIDQKSYATEPAGLEPYLSNGRLPICPSKGLYQWIPGTELGGIDGQKVRCTIHGHATGTFGG
ncbi:MAG: prepilin-type N-terminal cleavage/methylation domain-containing protein [Candidatus Riflebacteria bacterium]|nr:prepilin-type N-terminal cleavage/methylation domain-containing protein [Candidatus Riflebacteria bacterium]